MINLATISFPFLWSFESKISLFKKWYALLPAIMASALFFVTWDHFFTAWGVWGFNTKYITGIEFFGLPIEEWMFFFTVPYACVFIYESINYFLQKNYFEGKGRKILMIYASIALIIAFANLDKWYTSTAFFLSVIMLCVFYLLMGNKMLERFFIVYIVHLIPFFIVNGILTYLPVVTYNEQEFLGIRMGSIPLEDAIYSMSLLLMNLLFYELLKIKSHKPVWSLN